MSRLKQEKAQEMINNLLVKEINLLREELADSISLLKVIKDSIIEDNHISQIVAKANEIEKWLSEHKV